MSGKRTEAAKNGRVAHFVTQSGQRAAERLDALTGCFLAACVQSGRMV